MASGTERSYDEACAWLAEHYPACARGFLFQTAPALRHALEPTARKVFDLHARTCAGDPDRQRQCLEALIAMTVDFLRLQGRFRKTGRYARATSGELKEAVYFDRATMEEGYLDALFLSYAFWPNQVRLHQYFLDAFAPLVAPESRVLEVGTGTGLAAHALLAAAAPASYTGVDVSPFSLAYARAVVGLLPAGRTAVEWVQGELGNVDAPVPDALAGGSFEAAVCGEVLEHVDRPDALLHALRTALAPGGRLFLTTCANMEAADHVFLFASVDAIRACLQAAGLTVADECVLPVPGFEAEERTPVNYACILHEENA